MSWGWAEKSCLCLLRIHIALFIFVVGAVGVVFTQVVGVVLHAIHACTDRKRNVAVDLTAEPLRLARAALVLVVVVIVVVVLRRARESREGVENQER